MRPSPKFIILGEVRTGGTVLADSLSCHSDLRVLGEVLNIGPEDYWPAFRRPLVAQVYPCQTDVTPDSDCASLLSHLFESYNGFVLHREFQLSESNPTWDYLASKADLQVIHLYRRNLLRQYLSEQLALASQIWHASTSGGTIPDQQPIRIDPIRCLHTMRRRQKAFEEMRRHFNSRPSIRIDYEDIDEDLGRVLAYCQGFLGVPCQALPVRYRKLTSKPLSQLVSNLDEIRASFAGTEFLSLLSCDGQ